MKKNITNAIKESLKGDSCFGQGNIEIIKETKDILIFIVYGAEASFMDIEYSIKYKSMFIKQADNVHVLTLSELEKDLNEHYKEISK